MAEKLTERQKRALEIKNRNHKKIYLQVVEDDEDWEGYDNLCIVTDLGEFVDEDEYDNEYFDPEDYCDMYGIPDWTPDWLYEILDLWDAGEEMESYFTFESREDVEEFKKICDAVC